MYATGAPGGGEQGSRSSPRERERDIRLLDESLIGVTTVTRRLLFYFEHSANPLCYQPHGFHLKVNGRTHIDYLAVFPSTIMYKN